MDVKELLESELKREIEEMADLEYGSDAYKASADGVAKLLDKYIAMDKMILDSQDKFDARDAEIKFKKEQIEADNEIKRKQIRDERIDRIVKNALTAASIFGGFALTVWGTRASFEFEKEGSITTIMGRGFINKLLPKK